MPHKPTDKTKEHVKRLSLAGWSQDDIAYALNISDVTLRKYYDRELNETLLNAGAEIADMVYENAKNGCKDSMKLFLTHRCKWSPYKPPEKQDSATPQDFETFIKLAKAFNESGNFPDSK